MELKSLVEHETYTVDRRYGQSMGPITPMNARTVKSTAPQ